MDQRTRKAMRQCQADCSRASKHRPYIERKDGGRGLQSVEMVWEGHNNDPQVQGAFAFYQAQERAGEYGVVGEARNILDKYNLDPQHITTELPGEVANPRALCTS